MNRAVLKKISILTLETLLLLVRDRVMIPVFLASVLISIFANLASDWTVEDFTKTLFDIGYFGFSVTGSLMAIFWGTKILTDSRLEGSVEVQLSAPVSRPLWLLGKFGGLKLCLLVVTFGFAVIWQIVMLLNDFGWMTLRQVFLFIFMYLGWLVLASLAMLFATIAGQATATFSSLGLWLVGLSSATISRTLSPETPDFTKKAVQLIARLWNLQEFNLLSIALTKVPLNQVDLTNLCLRAFYGIILCLIFLVAASWSFSHRDLSS
jgi:Cu-processing system permease protein